MHRDIDRWISVAVAVALCLCGPALGQEEEDADAVARRIEERLVEQGVPADELPERLVQAAKEELGAEAPKTLKIMIDVANRLYDQGKYGRARELEKELLAIRRRVLGTEHPKTLATMNNLSNILRAQGDLSGARELDEKVLDARRRLLGADHPDVYRTMANLALTLKLQGDFSGARKLEAEVLEALRRLLGAEHPDTLRVMGMLAATLRSQGDLSGAKNVEEELLTTTRGLLGAEHPQTLSVMANLAATLKTLGDLSRARDLEEQTLASHRRVLGVEHPDTLMMMNNLAVTLGLLGDLSGARELYEEQLPTLQRVLGPHHPYTVMAMGNLAMTLGNLGDLSRARDLEEQTLASFRRVLGADHPDTLTAMGNLATTLKSQGDLSGARELEQEVLEGQRALLGVEHPHTLVAMGNLAATLSEQRDLVGARELFEKVLEMRLRVLGAESPATLSAMENLAQTLSEQGDLAGARELYERVLEMRLRVLGAKHPDTLRVMNSLAAILFLEGKTQQAREITEKIIELRQSMFGSEHEPNTIEEARTFHLLGRIYRDSQDFEKTDGFFRQALDALEAQSARVADSEDLESVFRAQYQYFYHDAVITSVDLARGDEALNILERSRARSFLTMLSERELVFSEIPGELAQRRRTIASRYDRTFQELDRLHPEQDREAIVSILKEQRELRRRRERVAAEIRLVAPRLAELEYSQALRVEDIRQALDPSTLMLSYSVGKDRTDLFTLSRDGKLAVHQLPLGEEELRDQVERFADQVHGSTWTDLSTSRLNMATWLYQKLIEPAADRIEKSHRLLIIPDGPLHYLPFAALIRKSGEQSETEQDWQYLVEWKPLHTVLSATVYAKLRKLRRDKSVAAGPAGLQLAAFGDPAYPGIERQKRGHRPPPQVRSAVDRGFFDGLTPLPHSRREVAEIGRLYPQEAAQIFLGPAATEEQAKAVGKDIRIVHFAVHGVLDPLTPLDSFLGLSIPEELAEDRDNGLLQAWEIFERVRLDADLVVLSGCQTAFGPERRGEGLISLSRAFQYAGARTVMASLWTVNDQSTAELMIRFYRHLQEGKSKDEALRAAQIELIRGGPIEVVENGNRVPKDYSAPYHWAAFQLIGDWQ